MSNGWKLGQLDANGPWLRTRLAELAVIDRAEIGGEHEMCQLAPAETVASA